MGAYPHNTQIRDFDSYVPECATTFFNRLQDAGYYTAHIGEAHQKGLLATKGGDGDDLREYRDHIESLGFDSVHETTGVWSSRNINSPLTDYWADRGVLETAQEDLQERYEIAQSYDLWEEGGFSVNWPSPLDPEDHLDGYISRQAIQFLENYDRDQPFALWVGIPGPHEPMDPPKKFAELYEPGDVGQSKAPGDTGDWVPDDVASFVQDGIGKRPADFDEQQAREVRAAYYGKISHIDHWIGELLTTLEERDLREETFVLYTSDHGELGGDHHRFAKHSFFEKSVRIPLLVSQPGSYAEGETSHVLTDLTDIYPTVLDVADLSNGGTLGYSLCPAARNPSDSNATGRDAVVSMFEDRTMYLTPEYKYAIDGDARGYLLFDRNDDPDEQTNLIGHPEYVDIERDLRDAILRFYQETTFRFRRDADSFHVEGT